MDAAEEIGAGKAVHVGIAKMRPIRHTAQERFWHGERALAIGYRAGITQVLTLL
jgi:hypothetical protein